MLNILLADDLADSAKTLARILQAWGHDCMVAHDGLTALKLAADQGPDVALLDIGMPKMNGYAVARRLLQQYPELPMYAITGYGMADDIQQAKEAGFAGHFLKPVDLQELRKTLGSISAALTPAWDCSRC